VIAFWLVWVALGLGAEIFAIATHRVPLTGVATYAMDRWPLVRGLVAALVCWLAWHWFIEPYFVPRAAKSLRDDGLIAGVLLVVGSLLRRRR
jgi:hypothetical protein